MFDPARLQLPEGMVGVPTTKRKPAHHRKVEPFLRGPLSWTWLTRAARLPGRAIHVGLVLWRRAGLRKTKVVKLSYADLISMGVTVSSAKRGLARLELDGLVSVVRHPGRNPIVTLLDVVQTGPALAPVSTDDKEDSR